MPGPDWKPFFDIEPLLPWIAEGRVLLTPNLRIARQIKSAWDRHQLARGLTLWEPLAALPLEEWLLGRWQEAVAQGQLPDRVVLDTVRERQLWRRVIGESQRADDRYSLIDESEAATLARQARDTLMRWRISPGTPAVRQQFELDPDCAAFLRWCRRFEEHIARAELATPADCLEALAACGASLSRSRVILVAVDEIQPVIRDCLGNLAEVVEQPMLGPGSAPVTVRPCPDRRAELAATARWAAHLASEHPGARVAIVLSDMAGDRQALEYLLRREFGCLGEPYGSLPVNFSTGITLDRVPLVRDALRVLELARGTAALLDVTALLQSRFLDLPPMGDETLAKFLLRLHQSGRDLFRVADLARLAERLAADDERGPALTRLFAPMANATEHGRAAQPSTWAERFSALLATCGWPGSDGLDSLEYQQLEVWQAALEHYSACDLVCGELTYPAALTLLRDCLGERASQPLTQASSLQVLGPLEAAGLSFDHLWLVGMQASAWPAAARPNPFIPRLLQNRHELPHASPAREWQYASGLFERYRRCSGEMVASYAQQQGGIPELASGLLLGAPEFTGQTPPEDVNPAWSAAWLERRLERITDDPAPAPDAGELATLGGGSSLLEDQSSCPFRAFARHRLAARALQEAALGPSAAERGSALHRALHGLFAQLQDSDKLAALDDAAETKLAGQAAHTALAELPGSGLSAVSRPWRELEQARLVTLLREWLAEERRREPYTVLAREEPLSINLAGLTLNLRADRIDQLEDGSTLMIDYKSGRCRLSDLLQERLAGPQLPLYALAAEPTPAAVAFAQVRRGECLWVGAGEREVAPGIRSDIERLSRGGWDVPDWPALRDRWRGQVEDLAGEFLAGSASVTPRKGACEYCGLQALCRVSEQEANR